MTDAKLEAGTAIPRQRGSGVAESAADPQRLDGSGAGPAGSVPGPPDPAARRTAMLSSVGVVVLGAVGILGAAALIVGAVRPPIGGAELPLPSARAPRPPAAAVGPAPGGPDAPGPAGGPATPRGPGGSAGAKGAPAQNPGAKPVPPAGPGAGGRPPQPAPAATLTARYATVANLGPLGLTGYRGEVTVSNPSTVTATGWEVTISLPAGQRVSEAKGADHRQDGTEVIFTPTGAGRDVGPGRSVSFTFDVSGVLAGGPTGCSINGRRCG